MNQGLGDADALPESVRQVADELVVHVADGLAARVVMRLALCSVTARTGSTSWITGCEITRCGMTDAMRRIAGAAAVRRVSGATTARRTAFVGFDVTSTVAATIAGAAGTPFETSLTVTGTSSAAAAATGVTGAAGSSSARACGASASHVAITAAKTASCR